MWTTETLDRMSSTIVVLKKDGIVRGSVKFYLRLGDASEDTESEELEKFVALVESMNDEE